MSMFEIIVVVILLLNFVWDLCKTMMTAHATKEENGLRNNKDENNRPS